MPNTVEQAQVCAACTPSDATTFTQQTALFVGVGGDVNVTPWGSRGSQVLFKNVPSGTFMPIQVSQVYSTSTTATDIVLLTNE